MKNKNLLLEIAFSAMKARGLLPEFSAEAQEQTASAQPTTSSIPPARDLSALLWCSIDNDDSLDLDQLSASERQSDGKTKVWVAIADVDALIPINSPVDKHAEANPTSVYTGVVVFPMLPEKYSTNLTSLGQDQLRLAVVTELLIDDDGRVSAASVYRALVKNKSKLAYDSVSAFLTGKGPLPPAAALVRGMDEQLKTQDEVAQKLRSQRLANGALELETIQSRVVLKQDEIVDFKHEEQNRARQLIEDLMIAANGATAKFLVAQKFPTLRRVVRSPERWNRIVELAKEYNETLPAAPDSKSLSDFLMKQKKKDALRFPDLSLAVIKLLGRGEYVLQAPGESAVGHFGLAVKDYIHSTAPNRRFPDLITQRLLKAAGESKSCPYSLGKLAALAQHCTEQENAADKVERQVEKSAAALFLSGRVGETFDGLVTGASSKGVWARIFKPSVEGRIVQGQKGLDVGDRVQLKLIDVNIKAGWIDFAVNSSRRSINK